MRTSFNKLVGISYYKYYFLIIISIGLVVIGQIFGKIGSTNISISDFNLMQFFNLFIVLGYTCLIAQGLIWLIVLRRFELSFVYPFMSLSYVLIPPVSYFVFDEIVTAWKVVGSCLIIIGIASIALGKKENKKVREL